MVIGNLRDSHLAFAFGYAAMYLIGNLVENEIGRSTSLTFIMFLVISLRCDPIGRRLASVGRSLLGLRPAAVDDGVER